MTNPKINPIESRALWVGVFANLIMAVSGYYFYFLTSSEALLLDGNFSMIAALVSVIAVYISKVKHQRSETFPFGLYLYESLFVFFKGLVLLGIILMAVFQNSIKVVHFFMGREIEEVTYGPILYYAITMAAICFGMAFYYRNRYQALQKQSAILMVEAKSLVIDGFMSLVVGISFVLISLIPEGSPLVFFHSIGDALLVIVLSVLFLKTPFVIIKNAFIEVGGGSLQDKEEKEEIVNWIRESLLKDFNYNTSYINKTGSSYLAVIYLRANEEKVAIESLKIQRSKIDEKLKTKYSFTDVELIIS